MSINETPEQKALLKQAESTLEELKENLLNLETAFNG